MKSGVVLKASDNNLTCDVGTSIDRTLPLGYETTLATSRKDSHHSELKVNQQSLAKPWFSVSTLCCSGHQLTFCRSVSSTQDFTLSDLDAQAFSTILKSDGGTQDNLISDPPTTLWLTTGLCSMTRSARVTLYPYGLCMKSSISVRKIS